jgi:tetratricopeptide (TPR) repeat protein/transcriptional regulator with XRE-family HTH domain
MASFEELSFGQLLKQLRIGREMTQEELAAASGLSPRTISDLERGVNHAARKDTARLIADALDLSDVERKEFEVARKREVADAIAAPTRTLPHDPVVFAGREKELGILLDAPNGVKRVVTIGGMAGVGKTALAVHAAHRLTRRFPDGQIFLRLHGHTTGRVPVNPADALASLLQIVRVGVHQIPRAVEDRASLWRDRLDGKKLLLLLDDAVDSDQVRSLLPGSAGSLVLITSRNRLAALEDAVEVSLEALTPAEAADLLARLADRPDVKAADPAVAELCRLCGFLPLAIGLLASRMRHHNTWTLADFATELTEARDRLAPLHAENLSVAAAFGLSYQDLSDSQRCLLRRLGLHPGTDIDAYAAAALCGISLDEARDRLEGLFDHYLLAESGRDRYHLHDLLREYARHRATEDPPDERTDALIRLFDYYAYTAGVADQLIGRGARARTSGISKHVKPEYAPDLEDRSEALDWMNTERPNLSAVATAAPACGRPDHATEIPAAMHAFFRGHGHWDQAIELNHAAVDAARHVGERRAEARALTNLGEMQYLTDHYQAAADSLDEALRICTEVGDRPGQADALRELGTVCRACGDQRATTDNLDHALEVYMSLGDKLGEADVLRELGAVLRERGHYSKAKVKLEKAFGLFRALDDRFGEAETLSQVGLVQLADGDYKGAVASQQQAVELFGLLGDRLGEANALAELGNAQHKSGAVEQANATLDRARLLFSDLGDRSGEAKALNNLGELARTSGDPARSQDRALTIAAAVAAPHEEARAHEGIGQSCLARGWIEQGEASIRRAVQIYLKMGSPHAERAATLLRNGK